MKNYFGISNDHSGSMTCVAETAKNDYNTIIESIRASSIANSQDTIINVVQCGIQDEFSSAAINKMSVVNSNILAVKPIDKYVTNGRRTPLWDSVGMLIDVLEAVPDANDENTSFLVMVITDGVDNASMKYTADTLMARIKKLQETDRWTFVFRVPNDRRSKNHLIRLGIPDGNIYEWQAGDATSLSTATVVTSSAVDSYYKARSAGERSSKNFYSVDTTSLTKTEITNNLVDVSVYTKLFKPSVDGQQIRDVVEENGESYIKGRALYQLVKSEKAVQDYKLIAIRDRVSGRIYAGAQARDLLGLPHDRTISMSPGKFGNYDVFIQSTSVNRKIPAGSNVLYLLKNI